MCVASFCRFRAFFVFLTRVAAAHSPVLPRRRRTLSTRRPGELPEELMTLDCLALLDLKDNKLVGELIEPAWVHAPLSLLFGSLKRGQGCVGRAHRQGLRSV